MGSRRWFSHWPARLAIGVLVVAAAIGGLLSRRPRESGRQPPAPAHPRSAAPGQVVRRPETRPPVIPLSGEQQRAFGLTTAPVRPGRMDELLTAPGRVAPDEARYARITPRAAGVIRTVTARIGQHVRAGQLLATVDSPEVGAARLGLFSALQELQIARARAHWEEMIYRNSLDLLERLRDGKDDASKLAEQFKDRPAGKNLSELLSAYAQYRLTKVAMERHRDLMRQGAMAGATYEQAQAEYEAALAQYQGLIDRMGYEVTLAYNQARQQRRRAETAVRVAQERLRLFGVSPEDLKMDVPTWPWTESTPAPAPPRTLEESVAENDALDPDVATPPARHDSAPKGAPEPSGAAAPPDQPPVSTYEIRAPFDGIILDRAQTVPGVAVDPAGWIFTLADLSSVWIEADVHESDYDVLAHGAGGRVAIRSPAYPDRTFPGEVLYTGDLVDERSRTVKLLARADNPDRLLKPGMFVTVAIHAAKARELPTVPGSALLSEGPRSFVFVRVGPGQFERRDVVIADREDGRAAIARGLRPGEEVVIAGAFELKALAEAGRLVRSEQP